MEVTQTDVLTKKTKGKKRKKFHSHLDSDGDTKKESEMSDIEGAEVPTKKRKRKKPSKKQKKHSRKQPLDAQAQSQSPQSDESQSPQSDESDGAEFLTKKTKGKKRKKFHSHLDSDGDTKKESEMSDIEAAEVPTQKRKRKKPSKKQKKHSRKQPLNAQAQSQSPQSDESDGAEFLTKKTNGKKRKKFHSPLDSDGDTKKESEMSDIEAAEVPTKKRKRKKPRKKHSRKQHLDDQAQSQSPQSQSPQSNESDGAEVLTKKTKGKKRKKIHSHLDSDGDTKTESEMSDIEAAEVPTKKRTRKKRKKHSRKQHLDAQAQSQSPQPQSDESQSPQSDESDGEGAMTPAISDRAKRLANYKPHSCLDLRIDNYRNPKKLSGSTRINEPIFGIWWCVPETHYIFHKPTIPEEYRLKGERGLELKLHFMEKQNQTCGDTRAKPYIFDSSKTEYLEPFFCTEYPCLDNPSLGTKYIQRSYMKHLSKQSVLNQASALELMASCHDRFQMATLLRDMRHEAPRFAMRYNRFFRAHPTLPDKFQMLIGDLWTLTQELVGSTFYPKLEVKKGQNQNNIYLHHIVLFVNEYMQPIENMHHYDGPVSQIVTF